MLETIGTLIIIFLVVTISQKLNASSNCKKQETADMTNENTTTQPASVDSITVAASSAKVTITPGDVSEITIQPNNPEAFEITTIDNKLTVKEKASSSASVGGTVISGDFIGGIISGSRGCSVVCNGGGIFGLSQSMIGGKHIVKVNGLTITSSTGCQIVIDNKIISINGQQIESPRWGSTIEVKADGIYVNGKAVEQSTTQPAAKAKERNALRIIVPRKCEPALTLIGSSDAEFTLTEWTTEQSLTMDLYSDAKLTAGLIRCFQISATLTDDATGNFGDTFARETNLIAQNNADITVGFLGTCTLNIHSTNDALVSIKAGSTETGTAKATNDSAIRLKGNFEDIRTQQWNDAVVSIRKS